MSHANAGRQDIAVIFQENVPGEACSLVFSVPNKVVPDV